MNLLAAAEGVNITVSLTTTYVKKYTTYAKINNLFYIMLQYNT